MSLFGSNGNHPDVPIIGQPVEIKGYLIIVQVVCKCDPKEPHPMMARSDGAIVVCPGCKRGYFVRGITAKAGEKPHVNLGIQLTEQPTSPPAGLGLVPAGG